MSAFCVYAASMGIARERAEKKTPNVLLSQGVQHILTAQEWKAQVDLETQRIFKRMKPVRASPCFDTPHRCLEWIALAEKSGFIRDARVMAWQLDKYSDGSPVYDNKGRPKMAWLPYREIDQLVPDREQAVAVREAA